MHVVSVPVAAHSAKFEWQLSLYWFAHQRMYGEEASSKIHAIVVNCNEASARRIEKMPWDIDVPHTVCSSVFDWASLKELPSTLDPGIAVPLNIQIGLEQVLSKFDDDQVIELTDCDMFHFRPRPEEAFKDDELHVSTIYENWHLHSLGKFKSVINCYFENGGKYYNGGFVPIVGKVSTFKKILPEWIAIHLDILKRPLHPHVHWWAGMYALQAACEKARVLMVAKESCYVPDIHALEDSHYSGHYSVDKRFDKRKFPHVNQSTFIDNPYYGTINAWLSSRKPR